MKNKAPPNETRVEEMFRKQVNHKDSTIIYNFFKDRVSLKLLNVYENHSEADPDKESSGFPRYTNFTDNVIIRCLLKGEEINFLFFN